MFVLPAAILMQLGKGPDSDSASGLGIMAFGALGLACSTLIVILAIQCLFLMTLSRCLARCARRNRTIEPGQVWLNLIPLFNLYWMYVTVTKVAESLENEFRDRGLHRKGETYARGIGLGYWGCMIGTQIIGIIPFVNMVSPLLAAAVAVLWILYWVKIAGYAKRLDQDGGDDDRDRDEEERDDLEDDDR